MNRIQHIIGFGMVITVMAAGCGVSTETHQSVLDSLQQTEAELENCQQARAELDSERNMLFEQVQGLDEDLASCTQGRSDVMAQLQAIEEENRHRETMYQAMMDRLSAMVDAGTLEIALENDRLVIRMRQEILFPSGSAVVSDEGREALSELASVLVDFDTNREFQVEGHTDNVPISNARFDNNWELSTARAVAVVEQLTTSGVSPEALSAAGFGQWEPRGSNDT
ncbi:MAG: OmpA family protein, partial [Myxococcales bacterium]|nr:OmpA family protein [Myxococcales bacterium]